MFAYFGCQVQCLSVTGLHIVALQRLCGVDDFCRSPSSISAGPGWVLQHLLVLHCFWCLQWLLSVVFYQVTAVCLDLRLMVRICAARRILREMFSELQVNRYSGLTFERTGFFHSVLQCVCPMSKWKHNLSCVYDHVTCGPLDRPLQMRDTTLELLRPSPLIITSWPYSILLKSSQLPLFFIPASDTATLRVKCLFVFSRFFFVP